MKPLLCYIEVIPYEPPFAYVNMLEGKLCFEVYYLNESELEWYACCSEAIIYKMMQ